MPKTWDGINLSLSNGNYVRTDLFAVVSAVYVSRRWDEEPLWIMAVAPPGSGKTCTTSQFEETPDIEIVGAVTPASLISGWGGEHNDPSMFNRIDRKLLIAKDFGTILSMGCNQMNEIFSLLREAFDGQVSKDFGMLRREYNDLHFNFVAVTTEACERASAFRQQLGERFMRFDVKPPHLPSPPKNISDSVKPAVADWLYRKEKQGPPNLSNEDHVWISRVAKTTAKLRTEVIRDTYSKGILEIPGFEGSARLEKQMKKMYQALKLVTDNDIPYVRRLCKRAARSSITPRKLKVLKILLDESIEEEDKAVLQISERMRYGDIVIRRLLEDLRALRMVERRQEGFPKKYIWYLPKRLSYNGRTFDWKDNVEFFLKG